MKLIFSVQGEYLNGCMPVLNITEEDVKNKNVFNVFDANAIEYIRANRAVDPGSEEEVENENGFDLDSLTTPQLKEFAKGNKIDISKAKNKKEILDIIEASLLDSE